MCGAWPGGKARIWVDTGKGLCVPCSGGWHAWRLVETSAVCIEKEELAGQEGGVLTPR